MFARLFGGRAAPEAMAMPPPEPEGLLYAVGDLHGRTDLLLALMERILDEAHDWNGPPEIVFLGDYVDRGGGVRDLLDLLCEMRGWPEIRPVFLMGNHERMLLRFLGDPVRRRGWLRHGAEETLESYGLPTARPEGEAGLRELRDRLAVALGEHRAFLEATRPSHLSGNLLCTHAGADPALPPGEQGERALLWGHPDFGAVPRRDGTWVAHGHVPVDLPSAEAGRIAVDTGAWFTGRLTAARVWAGSIGFLSTDGGEIAL